MNNKDLGIKFKNEMIKFLKTNLHFLQQATCDPQEILKLALVSAEDFLCSHPLIFPISQN